METRQLQAFKQTFECFHEKQSKFSIIEESKYTFAFANSELSNGQHGEVCTFQGAARQGLDQFQGKATRWSFCRSIDSVGRHVRVQCNSWPMAG